MEQTTTDHDTGGIGRRQLLSAVGGSAVAAALAGCSTLLSDGETADQGGSPVAISPTTRYRPGC